MKTLSLLSVSRDRNIAFMMIFSMVNRALEQPAEQRISDSDSASFQFSINTYRTMMTTTTRERVERVMTLTRVIERNRI